MRFTGERRWASGNGLLPEYGAIFMSNARTKEECLRKKLFGLPSSFVEFVKKVKVGMVLFLFEYEQRKLYGVFEAVSDGEIDIVPAAYGSSGKRFPAQVRVRNIWNCDPLAEDEFSDAIKDNYFSSNKFHFGLSKYQVQSLLHLFSSRKRDPSFLTVREPRRKLSRSSESHETKSDDPQWCDDGVKNIAKKQVTVSPGSYIPLVSEDPQWYDDGAKNIAKKQVTVSPGSYIPLVSSLDHSPSSQITQSSVNLSRENHLQHDSAMVQGCSCCCDCCDELGDFIPLSAPSDDDDDDAVLVEGELLPPYDRFKYAPYSTAGDQHLSEPYIPMPIFCSGSSEKIGTDQESPVGSLKCPYPRILDRSSDAKQANSFMGCQELGNASKVEETPSDKCMYCDIPGERKSVFSRLNFASKATEEEENHARVDKFMNEIMEELQHKHDIGWNTAKDANSAERVGKGISVRRSSVFQRLGGGFSKSKSTGKKRSSDNIDTGYMEFMEMHSLDWENVPPPN